MPTAPVRTQSPTRSPAPEERDPYLGLKIGMEFESLTAGATAIVDAIVEARQSLKVLTGNNQYWHAECREKKGTRGEDVKCAFKVSTL